MSTCRSCNAPLVWAKTETGRPMPFDAEPVVNPATHVGLFRLVDGVANAATVGYDGPFYRSHFATCPDAAKFRKAR